MTRRSPLSTGANIFPILCYMQARTLARSWTFCTWLAVLAFGWGGSALAAEGGAGTFSLTEPAPWQEGAGRARLVIRIVDASDPERLLPVRAIVKGPDGAFADGSGRGTYADGRFFADGEFEVVVAPGRLSVDLRCGPDYVPQVRELELAADQTVRAVAAMHRWFSPRDKGWYCGDNHVHAQHDAKAVIRTDLAYTVLQGRANGLDYLTESGSAQAIRYDDLASLSSEGFLLRVAEELRPGPFLGHFNPPGIREAIPPGLLKELSRSVLPHHAIGREVRERGGVMIHTHPTMPPHQKHWMGATILMADAVLGTTPEAMDQDYPASMALWFAALNLGNRIAAAGSTDAALGRRNTRSPGDWRVYSRADDFSYEAIIDGIRRGRTCVTNGGPLFVILEIGGREVGETVIVTEPVRRRARPRVHALHPLRRLVLYVNGVERHRFEDAAGRDGHLVFERELDIPADRPTWVVARAESRNGDWAMTSPIYFQPPFVSRPPASFQMLQISNATRFATLSRDFFAHLLVTVRPGDELESVELLRDGLVVRRFDPAEPEQWDEGRVPVTEPFGSYGPGWTWHRIEGRRVHFQADWPVRETGHYSLRARTASGRRLDSDAVYYDADHPASRQIGVARLEDGATELSWWGYGQEAPLVELPEGDHWWYPQNTFWRMATVFEGQRQELSGGNRRMADQFRITGPDDK